jgi:hypothetical protein
MFRVGNNTDYRERPATFTNFDQALHLYRRLKPRTGAGNKYQAFMSQDCPDCGGTMHYLYDDTPGAAFYCACGAQH